MSAAVGESTNVQGNQEHSDAYERLLRMIITLEVEPGSLVSAADLADRAQMSVARLRDALDRLERLDLVSIVARAGVLISPVSFLDIQHVFEARLCLEPCVARLAAAFATEDDICVLSALAQELHDAAGKPEVIDPALEVAAFFVETDRRFHTELASACRNPFLQRCLEPLLIYNARVWTLFFRHLKAREQPQYFVPHEGVVAAISDGDREAAARAMKRHLQESWAILTDTFSSGRRVEESLGADLSERENDHSVSPSVIPRSPTQHKRSGD